MASGVMRVHLACLTPTSRRPLIWSGVYSSKRGTRHHLYIPHVRSLRDEHVYLLFHFLSDLGPSHVLYPGGDKTIYFQKASQMIS